MKSKLLHIILAALLLGSFTATAQVHVHGKVFGGGNLANVKGNSTVTINVTAPSSGSNVDGDVYGGGALADVNSDNVTNASSGKTTSVTLTHGKVNDVYGGGLGDETHEAKVHGPVTVNINGGTANNVFGCNNVNGAPQSTVQVDINNGTINNNVYGGGNLAAYSAGSPLVNIANGTIKQNVFGGGNKAGVGTSSTTTTINISGGSVGTDGNNLYGVYGGCNVQGTVTGNILVNITGGTIGADKHAANVFGGGYGNLTATTGDIEVKVNDAAVEIWGDVYGGSGFGNVNTNADNTTTVNILNGAVKQTTVGETTYGGNVYGGGLGDKTNNYEALVNGVVHVNIGQASQAGDNNAGPTIEGEVYGCNNLNGSPQDNVFVDIYHTQHNNDNKYPKDNSGNPTISMDDLDVTLENATDSTNYFKKFALAAVYGGGNQAAYTADGKTAQVTIHECSDNTIRTVYGGGNAADATNVKVVVEGGRFDRIFGGGNGYSQTGNHFNPGSPYYNPGANIYGTATTEIQGGLFRQIFGGSNQYGNIGSASLTIDKSETCPMLIYESFGGANEADITGDVTTTLECSDIEIGTFYGGSNLANIIDGDVTLNVYGGTYTNVFGGSKGKSNKAANIKGNVVLNLYGGTMTNAFGGSDVNGNITGTIRVNVLDYEGECALEVENIYGGGNWTAYTPDDDASLSPEVNVMHIKSGNSITGSVYGGGKGDADHDAVVKANPKVTIGYGSAMSDYIPTGYAIAENDRRAVVAGNVFGGGDYASVAGSTSVTIQKDNSSASSLFGGGNQASVGGVTVNVLGGNVSAGVYGGCNTSGTVGGTINSVAYDGTISVNIKSNIGVSGTPLIEGIYGGGKGQATRTTGNVTVTVGEDSNPTIYSDVYGGSALGWVNDETGNDLTKVDFKNGTLYGNIYGGGMGNDTYAAMVKGAVEVDINGGSVKGGTTGPGVYGGCNYKGTVDGTIEVNVNGGTIGTDATNKAFVHGGGYGQNTSTAGDVMVVIGNSTGTPEIFGDVYGGSALGSTNGTEANTTNHTYVTMNKGIIHGELYGGGLGNSTIPAYVYAPVTVNVTGGTVTNVYGCNNKNGAPQRTVKVNINKGSGDMSVGNVYGGGNEAAYTAPASPADSTKFPQVNLLAGAVTNVYGGGLGSTAMVTGNPVVNIQGGTVNTNVFGGGSEAAVSGNTTVTVSSGLVSGNVYGGGALANTNGTTVNINGGTVSNNIYGGGLGDSSHEPKENGPVVVNIGSGTLNAAGFATSVTGSATIGGSVFGGNDAAGSPMDDVAVNIYSTDHTTGENNNSYPSGITTVTDLRALGHTDSQFAIKAVYGGGNLASYAPTVSGKGASVHVYACDNTIKEVYGGGNAANVGTENGTSANTSVTIDGGRFYRVFGGGNGEDEPANIYGTASTTVNAGLIEQLFGGGNKQGSIAATEFNIYYAGPCTDEVFDEVFGGGNEAPINGNLTTTIGCGTKTFGTFYGGANKADISGDVTLNVKGGIYNNVFGGSKGTSGQGANIGGNVTLNLYGGTMDKAFGGCDVKGNINGKITVNMLDLAVESCGLVVHNIYGGGQDASYTPTTAGAYPEVNLIHGSVTKSGTADGNVFGGGLGTDAVVTSNPTVKIGYDAAMATSLAALLPEITSLAKSEVSVAGNVYGGGEQAEVEGSTSVTLQKHTASGFTSSTAVSGDVYGGGALADVTNTAVAVSGGTVNGNVYGGGMGRLAATGVTAVSAAVSGTSQVTVDGGTVSGSATGPGVYGGCNLNGTVGDAITVRAISGSIGSETSLSTGKSVDVFGGGYGANTSTSGNVTVSIEGATVWGDVYGGSALGSVNDVSSDETKVNVVSGSVKKKTYNNKDYGGNVYGGGLGDENDNTKGWVNGAVTVTVSGGTMENVFGCNNTNGAPQSTVQVDIEDGTVNKDVFGGGNLAAYAGSPVVNIKGGTVTQNVFGGGNQAGVGKSDGTVEVNVSGGTVGSGATNTHGIYGGCNKEGNVTGDIAVNITGDAGSSSKVLKGIYGGGKGELTTTTGNVTVTINKGTATPVVYADVYGGSALGQVSANDKLTKVDFKDGELHGTIYGGGMGDGSHAAEVTGATKVIVSDGSVSDGVYGGCNVNGTVKSNATVEVNGGTVGTHVTNRANVYGGGLGENTVVAGSVEVTIGETSKATGVTVHGDVYGGSAKGLVNYDATNSAQTSGTTTKVTVNTGEIHGDVYGGGHGLESKEANVWGPVTVDMKGGTVKTYESNSNTLGGNVYGCNNLSGQPKNTVTVNVDGGSVNNDVFGGGNEAAYGGNPEVNIKNGTVSGDVYGGGALANIGGAVTVNVTGGTVSGDIYGGGLGDDTHAPEEAGLVTVNIGKYTPGATPEYTGEATIGGSVYGCNNAMGSPKGDVMVNIYKTKHTDKDLATYLANDRTYAIDQVFGGGHKAHYEPTGNANRAKVHVYTCDNTVRDLFGGGDAANAYGVETVVEGGRFDRIFGGGNGAGNDNPGADIGAGGVSLTIRGGRIGEFFGGSNEKGEIEGELNVTVESGDCGLDIEDFFCGSNKVDITGNVIATISCNDNMSVKNLYGGSNLADIGGDVMLTVEGGTFTNVFGGSKGKLDDPSTTTVNEEESANIGGNVTLNLFGGTIENAFGGSDVLGSIGGKITVNVLDDESKDGSNNETCPLILHNVYGGGRDAAYAPNIAGAYPEVNLIHGSVTKSGSADGNVFGGGLGTDAVVTSNPTVKIGYDAAMATSLAALLPEITSLAKSEVSVAGNVYGGGEQADVEGSTSVTVQKYTADGFTSSTAVSGDVYGGGALADVTNTAVAVSGGTVNGNVYGGGMGRLAATGVTAVSAAVSGTSQVTVDGGAVSGSATGPGVFGGCNLNGTVGGAITVRAISGSIGSETSLSTGKSVDVFGGGYGANTSTSGNVTVSIEGATVWGDVYGGSALGSVNDVSSDETKVNVVSGSVKKKTYNNKDYGGNVYGGGLGDENDNTKGWVNGAVTVTVSGGTMENVFGCNNLNGAPQSAVQVDINETTANTMTVGNVYGGGNQAAYGTAGNSYPVVNLTAGTVTTNVFGGGLGETAKVTGNPVVNIQGGSVSNTGKVFGGGSAAPVEGNPTVNAYYGAAPTIHGGGLGSTAVVTGDPTVVYNQTSGKTLTVTSAFGGGDAAGVTGNTDVQLKAGSLTNAFGGGNVADITGTTNVTLEGATVANVYGGGNEANVSNTATVTVSSGTATGGVYGGCNTKGSVGAVTVDLNGGQVGTDATHRADVYGGGFGGYVSTENPGTSTTGNITVTLTGTTVYGDIYGGSAFGSVNSASTDLTTVNIQGDKLYGTVYGGGKGQSSPSYSATNKGKTVVNFETSNTNLTGIYGGANTKGNVEGEIEVNIKANVGADGAPIDIFGGGYGDATGTKGDVTVNIGLQDGSITPVIYGDIYGGSALGQVNDVASDKTTVNFLNGTLKQTTVNNVVHGNIYGGGLGENGSDTKGQVNGEVVVNISNTTQTADQCKIDLREASIFGCNNTSGSPQSDVTVNVYKTAYNFSDYPTGNKYIAQETGTDYAIDQVFGGGNLADYTATTGHKATVNIIGCNNTIRRVFGGGNAADATGVANVVDGGRFDYIFGGGNGEDAAASIYAGGTNLTVHGGYINHLFGGSNKSGTISGPMAVSVDKTGCGENIHEFFGGSNEVTIGTSGSPINLSTTIACGTIFGDVYGGSNLADIYGDVTLTINGGTISNVYAGSKGRLADNTANPPITAKPADIHGDVTLNIYGGTISDAFGGSNLNGNITGAIKVDMDWSQTTCADTKSIGNIYGGSNLAEYHPTASGNSPEVNIKHGTVTHSVFGGGKGDSSDPSQEPGMVTGNPQVTIGDSNESHCAIVTENVYGGGDAAKVIGNTIVTYNDNSSNSTVTKVFGGGNQANVEKTDSSSNNGKATVTLTKGKVTNGLYGGCNTSGTVEGKITVNADGGTVGTSNSARAYGVFGGGFGHSTATGGDIDVILNGATVYGDVYGGSAEGNVNEGTTNLTKVWMKNGIVNGNIYGGGFGDNSQDALVNGNVKVQIDNGSVNVVDATVGGGNVFGCNNAQGAPQGTVQVEYNGGTVTNIYGGGNLAAYTYDGDFPQVNINNGTVSGSVFGGGLGSTATVTANPQVTIGDNTGAHKAIVTGNVYGGGDEARVIGNTNVYYNDNNTASTVTKIFGGGNQASVEKTNSTSDNGKTAVTLASGSVTDGLYGGCNTSGAVQGAITVDINGGTAQTVFGGGYGKDTETGDNVTVTIDGGTVNTDVYGGSALGQVNDDANEITKVELKSGTVSRNIYGGGLGETGAANVEKGQVNGKVQVVVSGGQAQNVYGCNNTNGAPKGTVSVEISAGQVTNDVFGGGNQAAYTSPNTNTASPVVTIKGTGKVTHDVFGGGNQAEVTGYTLVKLQGGADIGHEVFGGGNNGQVNGKSEVKIEDE